MRTLKELLFSKDHLGVGSVSTRVADAVVAAAVALAVMSGSAVPTFADNLSAIEGQLNNLSDQKLPSKAEQVFFKDRQNLGELYNAHDFTEIIFGWFGKLPLQLKFAGQDPTRYQNLLIAKRTFERLSSGDFVDVLVYVPHPRSYEALEYNLVLPITELSPPKLQVTEDTEVVVADQKGHLYKLPSGRCSLLFKIQGPTFLNLVSSNCDLVKETAEQLDIRRFIAKMNS